MPRRKSKKDILEQKTRAEARLSCLEKELSAAYEKPETWKEKLSSLKVGEILVLEGDLSPFSASGKRVSGPVNTARAAISQLHKTTTMRFYTRRVGDLFGWEVHREA